MGNMLRRWFILALVAVPWFFRDRLATELDADASAAQKVLVEKADHETAVERYWDQRELRSLLARIELRQISQNQAVTQEQIDEESERLWSEGATEDIRLLSVDAETSHA